MFSFSINSHPVHGPSKAQGIAHVSEVIFWRNLLLEPSYLVHVKPGLAGTAWLRPKSRRSNSSPSVFQMAAELAA